VTAVTIIKASAGVASELQSTLMTWRYKPYIDDSGHPSPACFALRLVVKRTN
jgi:hypothetical protein